MTQEAFAKPVGELVQTAPTMAPQGGRGLTLTAVGQIPNNVAATALRVLATPPVNPAIGEYWMQSGSLCVYVAASSTIRVYLS